MTEIIALLLWLLSLLTPPPDLAPVRHILPATAPAPITIEAAPPLPAEGGAVVTLHAPAVPTPDRSIEVEQTPVCDAYGFVVLPGYPPAECTDTP